MGGNKQRQRRKVIPIKKANRRRQIQKKLLVGYFAIIAIFGFFVWKIVDINETKGEQYKEIVLSQQQYDGRAIPFKRGDILDRNRATIATSSRVYKVILDTYIMAGDDSLKNEEKLERTQKAKDLLEEYFEIDADVVDDMVENNINNRYKILKKNIPYDLAKRFEAECGNVPYVWLEQDYLRTYPYKTLACDLIGFSSSSNVGQTGLEASYNDILNGTDGQKYGRLTPNAIMEETLIEPVNGNNVVSTIDITLQSIVEKHILAFNKEHENGAKPGPGSKNTAVVIADPNTCEILAMASYPNYDLNNPNDLSLYYSPGEIKKLEENPKEESRVLLELWDNFCVSSSYEPGSTVKPFTESTGFESGVLSGDEVYYCKGWLRVPGATIRCHKREGHGYQTLSQGISNSCNVVMMSIAEQIGIENFCKYQNIFGFGQQTGIDLPKEAKGLLYTVDKMGPTDLASNSMGQNFEVTMTQMIAAYSALINGGDYYKPQIVKQVEDEDGNIITKVEPKFIKKMVSEKTSETLRSYMKQTMITGTGKNAQVEGYSIGAKTGTAEKHPRNQGNYLLSYMGFAPAENPEVLIYVIIDEPNEDHQAYSPYVTGLAKAIMEEAFPYLNITKETDGEQVQKPQQQEQTPIQQTQPSEPEETEPESDSVEQAPVEPEQDAEPVAPPVEETPPEEIPDNVVDDSSGTDNTVEDTDNSETEIENTE